MLEMGLMIGEGIAFQRQSEDLWDQSAGLYLQVFPQDQQVKECPGCCKSLYQRQEPYGKSP